MALNYLPTPVSQGQSETTADATTADDPPDAPDQNEVKVEQDKPRTFLTTSKSAKPAVTLSDAGSSDKNQRNPFLLTEEEKKKIGEPALPGQAKLGEGVVDDDLPTQEEWDAMGDSNAW